MSSIRSAPPSEDATLPHVTCSETEAWAPTASSTRAQRGVELAGRGGREVVAGRATASGRSIHSGAGPPDQGRQRQPVVQAGDDAVQGARPQDEAP